MVRFKAGITDVQFAEQISAYLGHLKAEGLREVAADAPQTQSRSIRP